ncbi:hypothetical protein Pmani_012032 [Petrolisthes manimaculis]|uniref:DDE Tnp4 domain-containing protein n=1 Tax=Petrolisthes manimaculis TaxID=1843537 RepID=A0AAE1PZF8_9EUCA|nr:hypothetical protein Pmani_012032 [Petrolisthes manimaculis]
MLVTLSDIFIQMAAMERCNDVLLSCCLNPNIYYSDPSCIITTAVSSRAHKKTRSVVERGIGQWKRRFHVLHSEISLTPPAKVCKIIFVCAILHNICKDRNIQLLLEEDDGHGQPPAEDNLQMANDDDDDNRVEASPAGYQAWIGVPYREELARLHFNNVQ